jgi:two-component system sensor histidine kinase KdpD
MVPLRGALDKAHVALVYLLVVLVASSRAGRTLGLALSGAAFLCFNFFFVPPYHTFHVAGPLDWLVLIAFLATSVVAAQLLARARAEALVASRRADEVERLSAVGAEALNAGRAEDALAAIASVIGTTLNVERCEIYLRDDAEGGVTLAASHGTPELSAAHWDAGPGSPAVADPEVRLPSGLRLVEWVAARGRAVVERADGAVRIELAPAAHGEAEPGAAVAERRIELAGARVALLPLRARDRIVGVLRLATSAALVLDEPRRRFLDALAYYAALGVERMRLVGEAEHVDALRAADRLKDALLASVSHDLRTPLTTIKALAHAIRMEGDERAATIEEEADRLNRFVADLLDLSRLAGGALVVTPEVNAVDDLLGAALQRVAGATAGREVDVGLDPADPLLLGRFDFVHALRIVSNLIENAVKYSPADTAVTVRARREGAALEVTVSDRGPGVPPDQHDRIFEAFYRAYGAHGAAGGAGLGLSIARQLAEAQGGSLRYSPRDGGGSRFTLRLPAVDAAELLAAERSL